MACADSRQPTADSRQYLQAMAIDVVTTSVQIIQSSAILGSLCLLKKGHTVRRAQGSRGLWLRGMKE
jgi:hypothetical protein